MSERCSLTRILRCAWARLSRAHAFFYFRSRRYHHARRNAAKEALENAQNLEPNSPETLLALGYYQVFRVLRDYGLAKNTIGLVSKMLPAAARSRCPGRSGPTRGHWDESIAYLEASP